MKTVKTEHILYPHKNENGTGHADGQPGDVDDGIDFVPQDVAEGYFEIVGKHKCFGFIG
jgi:hypothetical protein